MNRHLHVLPTALARWARRSFANAQDDIPLQVAFNPSHQPSYQCNSCRQVIQFDKLSWVVGKAATSTKAVERGYAHSRCGFGVGGASAASILNLQAKLTSSCFGQFDQAGVAFVAFEWLAENVAAKGDASIAQFVQ